MNVKSVIAVACLLLVVAQGARVDSLRGKHSKVAALLETKAKAEAGPLVCATTGDTHVNPFDTLMNYDIHEVGVYVMTSYTPARVEESFAVQISQRKWLNGQSRAAYNRDVALRCGKDVVTMIYPTSNAADSRVSVNGVEITPPNSCQRNLPNAPRGGNYCIYRRSKHRYSFLCGNNVSPQQGAANKYAWGMEAHIDHIAVQARHEYGNARVHLAAAYEGRLEGACGLFQGCKLKDRSRKCQPKSMEYKHHMIEYKDSLFQSAAIKPAVWAGNINPTDYRINMNTVNARKPQCARVAAQALGVSLERADQLLKGVDDSLEQKVDKFVEQCAFDAAQGLAATVAGARDNLCGLVSLEVDSTSEDLKQAVERLRKCPQGVDADAVLKPILLEQWTLAQLCNPNPPKEVKPTSDFNFPECDRVPTGTVVEQIRTLAHNVRLGIQKALARANNEWTVAGAKLSTEKDELEKKQKAKQNELDETADEIKSYAAKLSQSQTLVKDLKKKIEENNAEVTATETAITTQAAQRKQDNENYAQKIAETKALIAVIDKVLAKMSTLKEGEFLQLTEAAKSHSDATVRGYVDSTVSMMRMMQLAAKADETAKNAEESGEKADTGKSANVSLLKELLNKLRAQLVDYIKTMTEAEQKVVEDFNAAQKLQTASRDAQKKTGSELAKQLEVAEENTVQLAQKLNNLKKDDADLTEEKKDIDGELAAKVKEYNSTKTAHLTEVDRLKKELETINEVEKTLIHQTEGHVKNAKDHLQEQIKKLAKAYL